MNCVKFFKIICFSCLFFIFSCFKIEAKIYCGLPFCNEYEILTIHLEELYDYVDYFVIAESCESFRGNPKPYNFENNLDLYGKYLDKIIYVQIPKQHLKPSSNPSMDALIREHWQREHILNGLKDAQLDDILIFADCDEILCQEAVRRLPEFLRIKPIVAFKQKIYFFFLNYSVYYTDWVGPVATTIDYLRKSRMTLQDLRNHRNDPTCLCNDDRYWGWHFSSMGGFSTAYYKATNWGHWADEGNPHVNSINRWKEIGNMTLPGAHLVEIDDSYPAYVLDHKEELIEKQLVFIDYETSIQPSVNLYEKNGE